MLGALKWLFGLGPPLPPDGFGQSLADDLRFLARFRACRRRRVAWRLPDEAERRGWDAHPIVGRFGDEAIAVAEVDGRCWVVRDRIWFGWPDAARYVAFVLDGDAIWCAADFDAWPRAWTGVAGHS